MQKNAFLVGSSLSLLGAACGGSSIPPAQTQASYAPAAAQASDSPHLDLLPVPPIDAPRRTLPPLDGPSSSPTVAAAAPSKPEVAAPRPETVVDALDRDDGDKKLDAGRHPGEFLAFLGLTPGMHVAEIGAGTGYTTELLARAVAPKGRVWAQNSPAILKFVGKPWAERLKKPALKKDVVRVDRSFDAPLPPDAKNLDAVVSVLIYHDTTWLGVDRDKMNKAVFAALKPGAEYVIVDHSAAAGHGTGDAKTLHRIEEAAVETEVEKAGFVRAATADFLRNPSDARDWNDAPNAAEDRRGKSDRFVLKFVKPQR